MTCSTPWPWLPLAWAAVAVAGLALGCARAAPDPLAALGRQLPLEIDGWRAAGEAARYDTETIYSYIDGHAELYLAYDMQACLARRYTGPEGQPDVVLDVFWMATPQDAFGMFSHDRDGEVVAIGQDGVLRPGWLSFWTGPFFVSVFAEDQTSEAQAALTALGRSVAAAVTEEGARPELLRSLPADGLVPQSVHYLHDPTVLAIHLAGMDSEVYGVGPETPAVLADYTHDGEHARLLVVQYPDVRVAAAVAQRLVDDPTARLAEREDGSFAGVEIQGALLAVVVQSTSSDLAETLLDSAGRERP